MRLPTFFINYFLSRTGVFIFAAPPYASSNCPRFPLVLNGNLPYEEGIFVFKHGKDYDFSMHPRFLERRSYVSVNFLLFR